MIFLHPFHDGVAIALRIKDREKVEEKRLYLNSKAGFCEHVHEIFPFSWPNTLKRGANPKRLHFCFLWDTY